MPIILDDGRNFPTNQERIDALESPIARHLFQEWQDSLMDLFGDADGSVADMILARENQKRVNELSDFRQRKATKEEKAEDYRDQVSCLSIYDDPRSIQEIEDAGENPPEMEWDEDEDRLDRNLRLFARLMIEQGKLSNEDFEEE